MKSISKRKNAIFISLFLFFIAFLLFITYRPYIYQNHIFDFHFADTLTSWFSIPCLTLFFWGISRHKFLQVLIGCLIGNLLYEFFLGLTFDWYDVIAILLSAAMTYLIYIFYKRQQRK